MELFGGLSLPLVLVVLALIDGLSVGTLLIPLFLLLRPGRVPAGRMLLYLGTIATFYLLVGLLFLWGLVNLVDVAGEFLASPSGLIARLLVGTALLITSFAIPTSEKAPAKGAPQEEATEIVRTPSRISRWRDQLLDPRTRRTAIMAVAIVAGLVEVATMLPYIVAMTMLVDAEIDAPLRVLSLVAYCALMILPALALLLVRVVAASLVERPLARFSAWLERTGGETTAWVIGIIGFLIARSAATELGLFEFIGAFFGG